MDEGPAIAYSVLGTGVPVYSADGVEIGSVAGVLAAPSEDIFHGLLVKTSAGIRFVAGDQVAQLHEHGVDLSIDGATASALPAPEHGAPVYLEDPERQQEWCHLWHRITLRGDWKSDPDG